MQDLSLFRIIFAKRNPKFAKMKKKSLLWLSAFLLMVAGCSGDDYDYVQEFSSNDKENFIGTWHMMSYSSGWGGSHKCDAGEITVTFTKKGKVKVVNKREDQSPIPTNTYSYSFVDVERSIITGEPRTCISISFGFGSPYSYSFDNGVLYLSQEAYDGSSYSLQKLK